MMRLDNLNADVAQSLVLVLEELTRAEGLHPVWPEDRVYQAAIIAEEAGEVLQAALDAAGAGRVGQLRNVSPDEEREVVQCAAMCLRWLRNVQAPRQFEWLGTLTGLEGRTRRVLLEQGCPVRSLAAVLGFVREALASGAWRLWLGCGKGMCAELRAFVADVQGEAGGVVPGEG